VSCDILKLVETHVNLTWKRRSGTRKDAIEHEFSIVVPTKSRNLSVEQNGYMILAMASTSCNASWSRD
jgi:hypothetical protein